MVISFRDADGMVTWKDDEEALRGSERRAEREREKSDGRNASRRDVRGAERTRASLLYARERIRSVNKDPFAALANVCRMH